MNILSTIGHSNQSLPYRLADEFSEKTNRCLFITGKAGTGKTTFLKHLKETTPKNMAVVAPTGVAAINANGMTIHSFFQLPIRTLIPTQQSYRQLFAEQRMMQRKRNMLYHLELLVIDEISMVRADVLDAIDAVLRHYKYRRDIPFGGVQVIMIGDLMQLSPVVHGDEGMVLAKYYDGPYFFQSRVMQELQPVYIELDHVFRQQNEQFVRLLNEVRDNRLSTESKAMLASRYIPDYNLKSTDDFHITLTTHNQQADELNQRKLEELPARLYELKAEIYKTFPESSYPTDETLLLKEGARVMFIKNDDQKPRRFYNGKLGIVKHINGEDSITVECEDGEIEVAPVEWENIRYSEDEQTGKITEEMLGAFRQFPLRLAWAITIHKSQGLTFDRVIIDAARAFAAGQVYVALSRCRTLEGIVLSSPLERVNLGNDMQVLDYINRQPTTEQAADILPQAQRDYLLQVMIDIYDLKRIYSLLEQMETIVNESVSFNAETLPFLVDIKTQIAPLISVGGKFCTQLTKIILSGDNAFLHTRLQAAEQYFIPQLQPLSQALLSHPCRSKNKTDATDFTLLMNDLNITLNQKIAFMQAVAKEPTTEAYLNVKKTFVAPVAKTDVFGKASSKTATLKDKRSLLKEQRVKPTKPKKEPKPSTYELTFELYKVGNTPEQIAEQRNLTLNTVLGHLAKYVQQGQIQLTDLVPQDILNRILNVQAEHPEFTTLKEFYEVLNEEVPYSYLRVVIESQ